MVALLMGLGRSPLGAQAGISGTVFDSLRASAPLRGATVVLVEPSRYATSDERGRFHFDSVPPGRYTLAFMHPMLDSLDLTVGETVVQAVEGRTAAVRLFTPSAATLYARVCPAPREKATGFILGRVRDVDGDAPVAGAVVTSEWSEFVPMNGAVSRHAVGHRATTTASGGFIFCGVPADAPFVVGATLGSSAAGPVEMTLGTSLIGHLELAVRVGDDGAAASATLRGMVKRTGGQAVAGALVGAVADSARSTRTDAAGRFALGGLPPGTRAFEVRAVGLAPANLVLDLRTSSIVDTTIVLANPAQALKAVSVTTTTSKIDRGDFDRRRHESAGFFMTAADIARSSPSNIADLFRRVPAVRVGTMPVNGRGSRANIPTLQVMMVNSAGKTQQCIPNFFLDGAPYLVDDGHTFAELMDQVTPEAITGIEVYRPGTPMPPQFDRSSLSGCGSIVIWTR